MTRKWPKVRLREVLRRSGATVVLQPDTEYSEVTVRLWGKGVMLRRRVAGAEIAGTKRFLAKAGQFILSRIDARNGAIGIVPSDLDGAIVTNDFPVFDPETTRLDVSYLGWLSKTTDFVELCMRASEGTTNRVRLQEDRLLGFEIPLPPVAEQRRIATLLQALATKIAEERSLRDGIQNSVQGMLRAAYQQIIKRASTRPLSEVAPLVRRPVTVDSKKTYPQVAVRSFGRGTFHKPPLNGNEVTWEKPYLVKVGDILVSNIKAWEGALAVARPDDDGRVGSHRYLTCVPIEGIATARFVCFHLLTSEVLGQIGEASPGSADRNRTLSAKAFMRIPIPIPEYPNQLWFDSLCDAVDILERLQKEMDDELDALWPAILDRAFRVGL